MYMFCWLYEIIQQLGLVVKCVVRICTKTVGWHPVVVCLLSRMYECLIWSC
jgi:hypothetical protein